jgi:hypothetical protein
MSFYDVTDKYIQDKGLHRKGGYRGILSRKDLKSEISVAVFAATPPEVLKPIVKAKGISLILLEEIIQPELDDKYLSKINYTYLTTSYLLHECLLPILTRKLILHDYLSCVFKFYQICFRDG